MFPKYGLYWTGSGEGETRSQSFSFFPSSKPTRFRTRGPRPDRPVPGPTQGADQDRPGDLPQVTRDQGSIPCGSTQKPQPLRRHL